MPDNSILRCSVDSQFPNITFPSSYGTLEIKKANKNCVALKYYVSWGDAKGKTYTGSYHNSSGFSGWFAFVQDSDFPVVGKLMLDGGKRLRLQVERYADGNLYIAAYNNDTNTSLGSVKLT